MPYIVIKNMVTIVNLRKYLNTRRLTLNARIRLLDDYTNDETLSVAARSFAAGRMYSMKLELAHVRDILDENPIL